MNDFRSRILTGKPVAETGLVTSKSPRNKGQGNDGLESVTVPRGETRTADHRDDQRHRLMDERALSVRHCGKQHQAQLINLSGGGAMIEAPFRPELWDRVELDLGSGDSCGKIECAVRWIKGDRLGLEFAHETRIDADADTQAALLRNVLTTSFPDVALELSVAEQASPEPEAEDQPASDEVISSRRSDARHPLIWSGEVHFDHETTVVRLRNISAAGALVEGNAALRVGAELLLDLEEAGTHFAIVSWVRGDQAGLAFRSPFDLANLAKSRPQLAASRWSKPAYLRDGSSESSPWASEWGRLTLADLHKTLGRR
ncbi:MAG TPA: PilZ domain-containing protein [Sphingomicrobium sp.]|jgi:hypothetical protein|nr:PilZ domain-containing protein [Sphingomicrobium sp.]